MTAQDSKSTSESDDGEEGAHEVDKEIETGMEELLGECILDS